MACYTELGLTFKTSISISNGLFLGDRDPFFLCNKALSFLYGRSLSFLYNRDGKG